MPVTDPRPVDPTPMAEISAMVDTARAIHRSGRSRPIEWRRQTLRRLRDLMVEHEDRLVAALDADLGKPGVEAFATDIGFVVSDIDHTLAHLSDWARPRKVPTPIAFQPASSQIVREPLGVACVIAPWNYPVQLVVLPAVAAIAAGNTVVCKPSEVAPRTAEAVGDLFAALATDAVQVVQGGIPETTELLAQRFDHIFYTGNGRVGRIVMKAASEHLTPVTLELGGKSPTVVTKHANLEVAAKRIAWGKFLNAGQTCVAPDYVLVDRTVQAELTERLADAIGEFYGDDPQRSDSYARIVDDRHVQRLEKLVEAGTLLTGGAVDRDDRYVAPTIVTDVSRDDEIMQQEIFGPVLPIIGVDSLDEAIEFINADDKPLALYVFTEDDDEQQLVLARTSSGGVCVNATVIHLSNPHLPFGGVGESGMGSYHGEAGFATFSHERSVMAKSTRTDPSILYPPYTSLKEKLIRKGMTFPDLRDMWAKARQKVSRKP